MAEVEFEKIIPRGGSVEDAFEEVCCLLAARERPSGTAYERYRGDGGDGGIECSILDGGGALTGWQAKYVFDIESLLKQAGQSLATALAVHSNLQRYVVCFPFDLTSRTLRKGKSQKEKFDAWVKAAEADAEASGRTLTIERRSAHDLRDLLLKHDASGGIRHYFFGTTTLSHEWFLAHLNVARATAGPRYSTEINLSTPLMRWFSGFGETPDWRAEFDAQIARCRKETAKLQAIARSPDGNASTPAWSAPTYAMATKILAGAPRALTALEACSPPSQGLLEAARQNVSALSTDLSALDRSLADELNEKHGEGASESKQFRSRMAEYMVSFPAANLDTVRDTHAAWDALGRWLDSPTGYLAPRSVMVLTGTGGAGKTHSLCDIAFRRLEASAYTCVLFGHQFDGSPEPFVRLAEVLGAPPGLGRDGLLDALETTAIVSGQKLLIFLDAVNETKPRSYWNGRLAEFASQIAARPHLKLCVSCRTSFVPLCLPGDFATQAVDHKGFAGMERDACNAFFTHYGLQPPMVPMLQPELANPLYLKLVCTTLHALGLRALPQGWFGISEVMRQLLVHKERTFAKEFDRSPGAAIVSGSLMAIAADIASSGSASLGWSQAQLAAERERPQGRGLPVVEWLITEDLLIEDGPTHASLGAESQVRPAFERFGDLLVASKMLEGMPLTTARRAFLAGGSLAHVAPTVAAVREHSGLITALSIVVSETYPGIELTELVDTAVTQDVAVLVVRALSWRTPSSFTTSTQSLLRRVLGSSESFTAMDALMAASTQPSPIDAHWLHDVLSGIRFVHRDAFWCAYLRDRFEFTGIVRRLVEAIRDVDVDKMEADVVERWAIVLLWCTAAADRRVKDHATRSVVALLTRHSTLMPGLLDRFLAVDDDEVRERVLLAAYAALICVPDDHVLVQVVPTLLQNYAARPQDFENALLRDHLRCIAELAEHRGCLPPGVDPRLPSQARPAVPIPTPPRPAPTADASEPGAALVLRSCLDDDFNHYAIGCLGGWFHALDKKQIGHWIASRVLDTFGYRASRAGAYDTAVTRESGGGRSKPAWSERIGKKYQWVALYQLASRLHDSVERKKDSFERTTDRLPLILLEERKMDPTIAVTNPPDRSPADAWWIGENVDLAATKPLTDRQWVDRHDDLPRLESLVGPFERGEQSWLALASYPTWSEYSADRDYDEPYRSTWVHLNAFLVPEAQFDLALKALRSRNYFGDWLPRGASWLYPFVGEYPWASACNIETDDWRGYNDTLDGTSIPMKQAYNELTCEWEYDGSLARTVTYHVPTRSFFKGETLRWDGHDGFQRPDGRTVFRDPSATEGGPSTLLADRQYLLHRLQATGHRMLWTLLGEKSVLSMRHTAAPQVTYSQLAHLSSDGNLEVSDRVFFTDYRKDVGPAKPRQRRSKSK